MRGQYSVKFISRKEAEEIINKGHPRGLFLYHQGAYIVALDNSVGDVWTRAFTSRADAQEWLISI